MASGSRLRSKAGATPQQARRVLRHDFPFRRVALVLSGGGALGAYEVGVLKVLERLDFRPPIVAGVSVGATNAVVWLAHGRQSQALERAWMNARPATVGMSWATLALRACGVFLMLLSVLEVVLTLAGSPEWNLRARLRRMDQPYGFELYSMLLESVAWLLVALVGYAMALSSRRLESGLAHLVTSWDAEQRQRWLGRSIVAMAALYVVVAAFGIPWPWRFHVALLVAATVVWLANRPGRIRAWGRSLFVRLLPETGGRGLWRSGARRRLLERLVARGDAARLMAPDVHLILSACAVDSGRMSYFVNWSDPSPAFRRRIRHSLGEVVELHDAQEVVAAAVASGALPVLFEPVSFRGREYFDGGLFSNQPLRAVVADGADAILVVLVAPSSGPPGLTRRADVVELGTRVQELASWRDLQQEMGLLPEGWSREGDPARVCVVEPADRLPGSQFGVDPENAAELIRLGEDDAWRALETARWLQPEPGGRQSSTGDPPGA